MSHRHECAAAGSLPLTFNEGPCNEGERPTLAGLSHRPSDPLARCRRSRRLGAAAA